MCVRRKPFGFWLQKENQIQFLNDFAKKYGVVNPSDWGKITVLQIRKEGGTTLLEHHNGSLMKTLQSSYSNIKWNQNWFPNCKQNRANSTDQRRFFEEFAKKHDIRSPKDWGTITSKMISENGGTFLNNYNNSVYKALQSIFPETNWESNWFRTKRTKGFWSERNNHLLSIKEVAKIMNVKEPKDWRKVSTKSFIELGYSPLLFRYNFSIKKMLQSLLPEVHWEDSWFPKSKNWKNKEVQRKFLDNFALQFNIKKPEDWGSIKVQQVIERGGSSLMSIYGCSLFNALQSIYQETQWKREWFPNIPKYHPKHWNSLDNQRKFLDSIAFEFGVQTEKDWSRITISLIRNKGGNGLLAKYRNSLLILLNSIYPAFKRFEIISSPQQRILKKTSFMF